MKKRIIIFLTLSALVISCFSYFPVWREDPISAKVSGEWEYDIVEDGVSITKYTGSDTYLNIPDELGGYPVVEIGTTAFMNNTEISGRY